MPPFDKEEVHAVEFKLSVSRIYAVLRKWWTDFYEIFFWDKENIVDFRRSELDSDEYAVTRITRITVMRAVALILS